MQLAVSCQILAPIVGLETIEHPSSLFLDVTNLAPLYKTETRLIQKVSEHFRSAGYLVRIAIADTLSVAWGLAHYAPDNNSIAPAKSELDPLRGLPTQSLRLSPKTCDTLQQLGVTQVHQLLRLPRASLTARFGREINLRLNQATGATREVFEVIHTPAEYSAEKILEWPVKDTATTMVIVQRLIEEVCQQLTADACGALQWHIRLARQQTTPIRLEIKLFQPTTTAEHVMQLAEMQLENHPELRPLSPGKRKHLSRQSPVVEVHVGVTNCVQLAERQRKLFDEDPSLNRTALAQLINRLSSRLGQDQVTRPVLQSGAQPEFSFRLKPLVDPTKRHAKTRQKKSHYVMARPLRLLNPAIGLLPCPASQTLPATFQKPDHSVIRIVHHWGPERIETGWWRGETVCRDYWRIETEHGSQLWVYRDRRSRKWFLHGEF
jgi:protein ImuB